MDNTITRHISPNAAKNGIVHAISKKRPIFLWGPPGIGKSDIINQIGESLGAHVIDVRLSLWEPTDIKGIPYFDSNSSKMVWAPPIDLPDTEFAKKHKSIILFLDEMNSAPPAVQAAAYQLILNRRVGQYVLPDNVVIVAAGNRETDRGVTYRMPAPLANRFVHIEMSVDFDDWHDWAINKKIHKDVVGYVSFAKKDLYDFDPSSSSRAFATPRSWEFVSQLLDDKLNESTLVDLITGTIGEGLALKFMAHRKVAGSLPKPMEILEGKVTDLKTNEISAMYSLITALCYELQEITNKFDIMGDPTSANQKKFDTYVNNFLRFSMDNFEKELVVMGLRIAISKYHIPIASGSIECFSEFSEKYAKYIRTAAEN